MKSTIEHGINRQHKYLGVQVFDAQSVFKPEKKSIDSGRRHTNLNQSEVADLPRPKTKGHNPYKPKVRFDSLKSKH